MESRTASGLAVVERAAFPRPSIPAGPDTTSSEPAGPPPMRPQRWAGWPPEWSAPLWSSTGYPAWNWWGQVQTLTDTAWGCIDLNASVIASMPPYLVGASDSLNADWLTNPDPLVYTDWSEFAKQLLWDFHLGEAFVMPTAWYASGYPARFHVVAPWLVTAELAGDGTRRYSIGGVDVTASILAIRYQSRTDDARGHGPLEAGAGRLIAAQALARYATDLVVSGGVPTSLLVHPGNLNATQAQDLQVEWVTARMAAMGLPGVVSGGIDLKVLQFDPEKMALVDLSQFNEARIAFLLGVPPPLAALPSGQDSLTYNTAVMIREQHWQAGLKPKVDRVMRALSYWLLPRGTSIELNRDEYVKPSQLERAQTWEILHRIVDPGSGEAVLSVAEIRQLERFSNAAPSQTLTSGVLQ
jgi:hypothetical protein